MCFTNKKRKIKKNYKIYPEPQPKKQNKKTKKKNELFKSSILID